MSDQPDESLRPDDQHDIEREIEDGWARFALTPSFSENGQEASIYEIEPEEIFTEAAVIESEPPIIEEVVVASDELIPAADETPVELGEELPREPFISIGTLLLRPKRAAALRIEGLTRNIEAHPDSAANFVLRGDMLLKLKRYADAEMDFRRALDLAAAQVEREDWGVVAQVMQDRALAGLKQTLSKR